ncbi:tetratricopeptide repeat protein [Planktomarina temperata]|nr:tetratricopeptide repeat protein [Planktomarina temperata]
MAELTIDQALQQAIEAHKAGRVQEADRLYTAILKAQPKHPDANHNMGVLAVGVGKVEQALPFFKTALEANPATAQFWLSYIDALIKLGKLADGKAVLDQAKSKGAKGDGFDKLEQRLKEAGEEPVKVSQVAEEVPPQQLNILDNLKLDQALKLAKKKAKEGSPEEAKRIYQDILAKFPKNKRACDGPAGLTSKPVGKVSKAQNPPQDQLQSLINLYSQGLNQQALKQAETLVQQYPGAFAIWNLMGASAAQTGQLDQAIFAFKRVLTIKPDHADAYNNMGNTLKDQGKLEEAMKAYNKAITIKPDYVEAHYNMAIILKKQGKLEDAIEAYNKALTIKPGHAEAYNNMGVTLQEQGKLEEAIEAYSKALEIKPDWEAVRAKRLHQRAHISDWDGMAADLALVPKLGTSNKHVSPFALLPFEDVPERHKIRSQQYAYAKYPWESIQYDKEPSGMQKRLRVGYFSADFCNHATMYLMAQVFALHDKTQFELFAYSYGPDRHGNMREYVVNNVDVFHDVHNLSDMQIVELARVDALDIAVDLKGYTQHNRLGLFASGLAKIQISYLGYPGTLGTNFIDYIVADRVVIPDNQSHHYSEQIIYLPHTYQPTDNQRVISEKRLTREQMDLPDQGFVFCCFNNNYKISSTEFEIWMRLLGKVEGSVLWLLKSNEWAEQNLKKEAQARGINPNRLVFAERIPQADHLARQKLADLFLDTFNVNAHTTASDALWAGLPLVTKMGQGFAARVAGSLLTAIGLPELITETEQDYEALILELATNPMKLTSIKEKLAMNLLTEPLFNTELYTKHLENGYKQVYQNSIDGYQPQTINVPI